MMKTIYQLEAAAGGLVIRVTRPEPSDNNWARKAAAGGRIIKVTWLEPSDEESNKIIV